MDRAQFEKEMAEAAAVTQKMKELGLQEADGTLSEKGLSVLRSILLSEKDMKAHFRLTQETILGLRSGLAESGKRAREGMNAKMSPEAMLSMQAFIAALVVEDNLLELISEVHDDMAAIAQNHIQLRSNVRELVNVFEKSEEEGNTKLEQLVTKLDEQEKTFQASKKYVKFLQKWEADKIGGKA